MSPPHDRLTAADHRSSGTINDALIQKNPGDLRLDHQNVCFDQLRRSPPRLSDTRRSAIQTEQQTGQQRLLVLADQPRLDPKTVVTNSMGEI